MSETLDRIKRKEEEKKLASYSSSANTQNATNNNTLSRIKEKEKIVRTTKAQELYKNLNLGNLADEVSAVGLSLIHI